jgi:hypothetical protein
VEFYLINRRILKDNMVKEAILTSLPSMLIMFAILFTNRYLSIASFILAIAVFWIVYLKDEYFDRKLFTE